MKPIENGQRHRNMRYNRPRPIPKELQMCRPKFRPVLLQRIYRPHRHVGNDEEGDQLSAWFAFRLLLVSATPPPAIQDKHGLEAGLDEGEDFGEEAGGGVSGGGEVAADDGEHAVDEHAGLGDYEECVVQTYTWLTITLKETANNCTENGNNQIIYAQFFCRISDLSFESWL